MRKRRLRRLAAAGVGAAAAAVATGLVVERRTVRARKAGAAGADRLGGLRSEEIRVKVGDEVTLHAEVDEVAPYDTGASSARGPVTPTKHRPGEATLVFVHGYALNLDCWHFQREHFRGRRRIVLYDQRSHGRSDRSPREEATIDQLGRDLKVVLDELVPSGPVVLVGHSMGGMTIMALAEQHPELFGDRVIGVALLSTTAGRLRPHRIISAHIPDLIGGSIGNRLIAGLARAPQLVDSARRRGSNIGFLVTDKLAFGDDVPSSYVEFVDEMLAGTPFEVLAEFFPNFESHDRFAVLAAFEKVPTTIMCGTKDLLTGIGQSRKMAERIPGARLVEATGAGHMMIMERAGKVNETLMGLVADAERRATASRAS
ncbi:MAG TPA: alpha/beta hydrolase [Nocardioides sp.]|uniref:alpha/beta fold hydrolase n=1 Tax=Nocardioides sp. TaxID=35761 RepID=UPI002D80ABC6|nr:alpha/beta hydrolase [Nocardioides sp.]HET6652044.1 alpha/beta hydrolase [Nocardioides sp.]